ncbi:MAG: tRNA (N6-isopentenyl adenosine(37)-C2)-methylthiotransferase MiaB [Deltaproteobacteria bacterium]|nr:tRNA (N6-isopentenyl adenosine(37)-C2)-methylthiotransferase MiaB [Deltaproteobacteria bacterium]
MSFSVFIKTFGCQMNEHDSERMLWLLSERGYRMAHSEEHADLILLNTCSVRYKAEHKVYSALGVFAPLKEKNPNLIIAVGGCVAQQEKRRLLSRVRHLDLVFGPDQIDELPDLVESVREGRSRLMAAEFKLGREFHLPTLLPETFALLPAGERPVTAFVAIMKGCDKFCTFCIVPFVRGREKSRHPDEIVLEVRALVENGVKEVTLLGQTVNSYHYEGVSFSELLRRLDAISGLERLRFVSPYPNDVSDDLINCMADLSSVCEQIHLPVQSGSNRILEWMRRGYTREAYLEKILKLKKRNPDISISTDFIVGFPGESEEDFEETLSLMDEVKYDSVFSFCYSSRPGTKALRLGLEEVPGEIASERLERLQALQRDYTLEKYRALVGKEAEVLVEGRSKSDVSRWTGKTRSHIVVNFDATEGVNLKGALVNVKIEKALLSNIRGVYHPEVRS